MKNLKIGSKFLVSFGIIMLLFCVVIVTSIVSLISTGSNFTDFYDNNYQITMLTKEMQRLIQSTAKNVGYAAMTLDLDETGKYIDTAEENLTQSKEYISYLRSLYRGEATLVDALEQTLTESETFRAQVFSLARENKSQEAAQTHFTQYNPYLLKAQGYLDQINDSSLEYADLTYNKSKQTEKTTLFIVALLSTAALLTTVIVALYLTRSMTRPLAEIETAARSMAKGGLDVSIGYTSRDEMGNLSDSMRTLIICFNSIVMDVRNMLQEMAAGNFQIHSQAVESYVGDFAPILESLRHIRGSLSETLAKINESADQVSSGSDQVAAGAQALSQGATQQASSVEELAATIAEISGQVGHNAESAQSALDMSMKAGEKVSESNEKMQRLMTAVDNISEKSNQIGKIVKTIEDIAFQTNILALNAAVEAARAGSAGKGFAVVANEVRSLASKSGEAAKSTTTLIIESIRAVEDGKKVADEAAASMNGVVEGAQAVNSLINRIAAASKEQAASIEQVTLGIDQISSVVQTNSATAEQSAAASQELSGQAQMLKQLASKFRLMDASAPLSITGGGSAPEAYAASFSYPSDAGKYE